MSERGIEIHNGKVVIPYIKSALDLYLVAGQVLNVEKEGGVNENYWAGRFKATSTDNLALDNKWMAGILAEAAFTEGSISGNSRFSCIHTFMELGKAITASRSALFVGQLAPGTNQTVDAGLEFLIGGKTIDRLISILSGDFNYLLHCVAITDVMNNTESGTSGTKAGYIKINVGGQDRFIRIYDAGN